MSDRNRAEGWKHAKRSGHDNEKLAAELVNNDIGVQKRLLACAHLEDVRITNIQYGGLCETDVDCILGGKTKSKTDLWLHLSSGRRLNVSIKKEEGGQVFLIGIHRFIDGFEKQYHAAIPVDVKRALELYFGSAEDVKDIIERFGSKNKALELRKHRLVAETLKAYDERLYTALLSWFNSNMPSLFDFCFSKGLASNACDWADIVWYKNMVGENQIDTMIYLPEAAKAISKSAVYGTRNGGSTIQLPFGFVQWHSPRKVIPGNLQFHHDFEKICSMIK